MPLFFPLLLPWIYFFIFIFSPSHSYYSLSIPPSSSFFRFLIALPASVGMYFLGDGMDRDRFGGFGHDRCASFAISPAFPRHLSQFSLISPSDLPSHVCSLPRHISLCLAKERIAPVPIADRMVWISLGKILH
jgi:hypothetical protein